MRNVDQLLLLTTVILTLFGLLMIYNASSFSAARDFADKYYYLKEQSQWVVLGFISLVFFSFFDYRRLYYLSIPLIITVLVVLILVLIPGVGISLLGARRWINMGFFVFQPSEFVKLALAIYLSAWFSNTNREKGRFFAFLLLLGLVFLFIIMQPDMGTAVIVFAEAFILYFLSGANIMHFLLMIPVTGILGFFFIMLEPYRARRLAEFLNLGDSVAASSYHVKQILIALGMGGIFGVGLGNSLQKYAYLPENTTDSIFAIIAEELGFVGSSALVFLFLLIGYRGLIIASRCQNPFGRLLAAGITSFLVIQAIMNLGSQTGLVPLAGVPLPFISYGGSALIVDLASIGILLNISKHNPILKK